MENKRYQIHGFTDRNVSFNDFLNILSHGILLLDSNLKIIFFNDSFQTLTGFTLDQARGIECKYIVRSNMCDLNCPLKKMKSDASPQCYEGDIINKNRKKIPVKITYSPIIDEDGNFAAWVAIFEEITHSLNNKKDESEAYSLGLFLGHSPQIEQIFRILPGIAQSDSSVLIVGETGTGKDLLADVIHQQSCRSKGPFVKINCGALPESLLESELFGHVKGAFTGAIENKPGRFKLAHNGTLFLTEIGDLPKILQVKLLSFLDDHVIYPLGSTKGISVNVRIIAATHRDLGHMVKENKFREDLLFRLNVVRISIPPLRKREGDIFLLLEHFLLKYKVKFNKTISGFSKESLNFLNQYGFPGNVRELKNIVEFAVNICDENKIGLKHLPVYLMEQNNNNNEIQEVKPVEADQGNTKNFNTTNIKTSKWSDMEKQMILNAMLKAKGKKQIAADILGWGRTTLWRKMKHYEII